jgi:hypothetical protein
VAGVGGEVTRVRRPARNIGAVEDGRVPTNHGALQLAVPAAMGCSASAAGSSLVGFRAVARVGVRPLAHAGVPPPPHAGAPVQPYSVRERAWLPPSQKPIMRSRPRNLAETPILLLISNCAPWARRLRTPAGSSGHSVCGRRPVSLAVSDWPIRNCSGKPGFGRLARMELGKTSEKWTYFPCAGLPAGHPALCHTIGQMRLSCKCP